MKRQNENRDASWLSENSPGLNKPALLASSLLHARVETNQRPGSRSRDHSQPIRGQYPRTGADKSPAFSAMSELLLQ